MLHAFSSSLYQSMTTQKNPNQPTQEKTGQVVRGSKTQKRLVRSDFYFLPQHSSIEEVMLMKTFMVYKLKMFSVTVKKILWENYNYLIHSMCIYVQRTNANQK